MYSRSLSVALSVIVLLTGLSLSTEARAQTAGDLWLDVNEAAVLAARKAPAPKRTLVPRTYRTVRVNRAALGAALAAAPAEFSGGALPPAELTLPLPDGTFERFEVEESPIMEPKLAAKFPEVKTYIARGIDNPELTARLDQTPQGFHAIVFAATGVTFYIDPYWRDDAGVYIAYRKRDYRNAAKTAGCLVAGLGLAAPESHRAELLERPTGATLRTYRLAVACTGEYAAAAGGGTVLGALGAIVTTVNRVSAVYERDFAIRMRLVNNEEQIIFTNAATDGFTDNDAFTLINESQTKIDAVIGNANYDIGHTFSTGGGGLAGLGVVGVTGQKASGITGSSNPVGDPYDIDYVAHEMGHQFGGNHPFNGNSGNCTGGNRNGPTAYEPGSGTTIMAYAGICSPQDLAPNSDDYFHTISYDEIDNYTTGGSPGNVGVPTATGNTPPTIGALTSFTIPNQTPFFLTASATDPNAGDVLTYCWEEFDKGAAQNPAAAPRDNGASPIFRSFDPTTNATRIFPSLTYILNNANVPPATIGSIISAEFLPTTNRTMTFRVTVRDNRAGGGGSNYATNTVTSTTSSGPFALTSFDTASTIAGGSSQTITWAVANTTAAPVSCANVKISLSTDGGYTFPFVLAASTPNDGSETVSIPNVGNVATTQGRFRVEAVGNVFFDLSNADTTITSSNTAPVLNVTGSVTVQRGTPTPTIATVAAVSDADTPISVAVSNAPADTAISANVSGSNVVVTARADASIATTNSSRTYPVTLTVTDSIGSTTAGTFNLIVQPNPAPTLGTYTNQNVTAGNIATATPSAAPADANGNLGATPLTVTPTTLAGGGTLSVNQTTGVVTATTVSATATGTVPVRVTAQDTAGAAIVRGFNLVIAAAVAPANDNFASAQIVSGNSGTVMGANVNATKQAGEPSHAGNSGGASVWYQWTAPSSGSATFDTLTSGFDTLLAVYTGAAVNSLTPIAGNNDDPAGGVQSKVSFSAVAGTVYRIAVDGFNSASVAAMGNITLHYAIGANNPPEVTTIGGSLAYVATTPAAAIDSGIAVTDPDSTNLTGATVAITGNFAGAEDVLAFSDQGGIAGSYSAGSGVLTLSGSATVAAYQTALRAVTYFNPSATPSTALRTVTFTASDGGLSGSSTRTINVSPPPVFYTLTLIVSPVDAGLITPNPAPNGQGKYADGTVVTLTASANSGFTFGSFSGDASGTNNPVQVTMSGDKTVTGNFTVNPIVPVAGTYFGLIESSANPRGTAGFDNAGAGFLKLAVTATSRFTGTLKYAGQTVALRGSFGSQPGINATIIIPHHGSIAIALAGGPDEIVGTILDSGAMSVIQTNRNVFNKLTNPAPQAGKYTLLTQPTAPFLGQAQIPQGFGSGQVTVKTSGMLKVVGKLGDGAKFGVGSGLSKFGTTPLYSTAYKKLGSVQGMATFQSIANQSDGDGVLNWFKPPRSSDPLYPAGFTTQLNYLVSRFLAPARGQRVLILPDATGNLRITLAGGNVAPIAPFNITLDRNNRVIGNGGVGFKMSVKSKTGAFKGSFTDQSTFTTRKFSGSIFQKQNVGTAAFKGAAQTGTVLLESSSAPIVAPDDAEPQDAP